MFVVFEQGSRTACYLEDPEVTCSTDRLELHPALSYLLRPTVNAMRYPEGALRVHLLFCYQDKERLIPDQLDPHLPPPVSPERHNQRRIVLSLDEK